MPRENSTDADWIRPFGGAVGKGTYMSVNTSFNAGSNATTLTLATLQRFTFVVECSLNALGINSLADCNCTLQ
jgi:hypothetical protein